MTPQTGATVEDPPVADGTPEGLVITAGRVPAGDPERVDIVLGSLVPLVDVGQPFSQRSGRWGFEGRVAD